ncbi:MAG: hypothetical protein ACKVT1_05795 [Dehalococcoidia bacterium]
MLTELDDTLWHQIPTTFDHVGTSDPRFFDRYWFAIYAPDEGVSMQVTMGSYSNTNVLDAGVMVLDGNRQHNLRPSRALRPQFETSVGPVRVEVVKPMEHLRLVCAPGDHDLAFDLAWKATLPPEEEKPHYSRLNGRVQEEYQRFNQIGRVSGSLTVGGRQVAVADWWSARDHSWGIRPGIGGPQPQNGESSPAGSAGTLFCFLFFSTPTVAGHVQIAERHGARAYLTGLLRFNGPGGWVEYSVQDAELGLEFLPGTRRPRRATIQASVEGKGPVSLILDSVGPSFAMPGLGYNGWDDRLGLGVYRGRSYQERDTWDVTHPADVVLPGGSVERPPHRIQPVRVTLSTEGLSEVGQGSLTLVANGRLPKYGLE